MFQLPAYTVGSLTAKIKVECLLSVIEDIVLSDSPVERFKEFASSLGKNAAMLSPSTKHMVGRDLGKLEPSASLRYRQAA